jgi:hypothetical protein
MYGLAPYKHNETVLSSNQSAGDIINAMLAYHDLYKSEYDKLAPQFLATSDFGVGRKIFNFLKKNTTYKVESDKKQYIKSPAAILYSGSNDCKNYALFAGGILSALNRKYKSGVNWCYRYASYNILDKIPQHVFVVINPGTSNEIWVDPVLKTYNERVQPTYIIDKKVKDMALIALSGVGDAIGKKTKAERKENRKQKIKKITNAIKTGVKVGLKVGAAPARNAFLALTKVNFRSLATNLNNGIKSGKREQIEKFWTNLGGNASALIKSIEVGSQKKRLGEIGAVDPVTQAALITAASGIVLAMINKGLLPKEANIPEGVEATGLDLETDQGEGTGWDKVLRFAKNTFVNGIKTEGNTGQLTASGTLLTGGTIDKSGNIVPGSGGSAGIDNKTLLIGGAAVVAAAFLLKRK